MIALGLFKNRWWRHLAIAVLLCAGALAGCGGDQSTSGVIETSPPPRQVKIATAAETQVARAVSATGTLAAEDQVVLGTKVIGRLVEFSVDLGSGVRKGQSIARIDQSHYRLRLDQAEAAFQQARVRLGLAAEGGNGKIDPEQTSTVRQAAAALKEARLTHDHMAKLWEDNYIARAELEAAVAQLAIAEAQHQNALEEARIRQGLLFQRRSELEIARQQLADTVVVSPIDGAVSERHASVGQYLNAGAPVVTLVRIHPLRLRLAIPEREAGSMRVGQAVELKVEGDSRRYSGRVVRLSPASSENNRTLVIEAEVPNRDGGLRPDSFTKAEMIVEAGERIVTVPRDAIVTFAGTDKVLTVTGGRAAEKRVRTGRRLGEQIEVVDGLAAGDQVIVQPGNLVGGEPVQVVN
jgi:RND family efflux transporter MFP subunit